MERLFLSRWRDEAIALLPKSARVLEVGAGTGLNFSHYSPDSSVIASDYSIEMLERAKLRETVFPLVQADVLALPFETDSFDAVLATLVFCSVEDPAAGFQELSRVVKNDGHVVLLEHVRPPGFLGKCFDVLNYATVALIDDHFNRGTAETAEMAGLNVREVRRRGYGIFNLITCRPGLDG